jgi:hypothetical protein
LGRKPTVSAFEALAWVRHAAKRNPDAVCNAIGHILGAVTSAECHNYFVNAGYEST